MEDRVEMIKQAIQSFDLEEARGLLREALKNDPSAETYYLAALAALNDTQQEYFLNKAIETDPFYVEAHDELHKMKKLSEDQALEGHGEFMKAEVSQPYEQDEGTVSNPQSDANPASSRNLELQPSGNHLISGVTVEDAVQLRTLFNSVGYKHPHNWLSKDYGGVLRAANIAILNPDTESVIIHLGIGFMLSSLMARLVSIKPDSGGLITEIKAGQILITNKRMIILQTRERYSTTLQSGEAFHFAEFRRVDPSEFNQFTQFTFYGERRDLILEMQFPNVKATVGMVLQFANSLRGDTTSKGLVHYMDHREKEQSLQNYINADLSRATTLKQAFTQLMLLLTKQ